MQPPIGAGSPPVVTPVVPNRLERLRRRQWTKVMLATQLVVGVVLRALSGEGVVVPFVVTTAIVLAVLLLGWRAVSALVVRRRARA